MSLADFIYPPNGNFSAVAPSGEVNIFDTLEITYSSTWSALNLTLFCLIGDSQTNYGVYQVPGNPLPPSGTFRLASVASAGFTIFQFPAPCSFKLTQFGDNDFSTGGGNFEVVSLPGTSTTYIAPATAVSSPSSSSISSQTGSSIALAETGSPSSTTSLSSEHTATSSSSTSPTGSLTSQPLAQESVLSTGAKAGIGMGIAVAALAILALSFVILGLRRKNNKTLQHGLLSYHEKSPAYSSWKSGKSGYVTETNIHELEQTSRVELSGQPAQKRIAPTELA